jgi:hypothetical protein
VRPTDVDESSVRLTTVEIVFTYIRRFVVFGLGCWVIGNALINPEERLGQLAVGMVMVGVLPIENIFSWKVHRTEVEKPPVA